MLLDTQQIDVGDRMFIVNLHPKLEAACESQVADLRPIARHLLEKEEERQQSAKRARENPEA